MEAIEAEHHPEVRASMLVLELGHENSGRQTIPLSPDDSDDGNREQD